MRYGRVPVVKGRLMSVSGPVAILLAGLLSASVRGRAAITRGPEAVGKAAGDAGEAVVVENPWLRIFVDPASGAVLGISNRKTSRSPSHRVDG